MFILKMFDIIMLTLTIFLAVWIACGLTFIVACTIKNLIRYLKGGW